MFPNFLFHICFYSSAEEGASSSLVVDIDRVGKVEDDISKVKVKAEEIDRAIKIENKDKKKVNNKKNVKKAKGDKKDWERYLEPPYMPPQVVHF